MPSVKNYVEVAEKSAATEEGQVKYKKEQYLKKKQKKQEEQEEQEEQE